MSILLSAELEVDGDLKVTGTVESTTIDSLKAIIADLQAQLAAMQGAGVLQTRVYEVNMTLYDDVATELDLNEITGFDLVNPILSIKSVDVDIFDNNDNIFVKYKVQYPLSNGNTSITDSPFFRINIAGQISNNYHILPMPDQVFILEADRTLSGVFHFVVTAQFPN